MSLEMLAGVGGVHPMHLARAYRKCYGRSVNEALRENRLRAATRCLVRTDLPLAEIALTSGFYDRSHFTNMFQRYVGFTPGEYRSLMA